MSSIALGRLQEERKSWRQDHPHGFFAKPTVKKAQVDLMRWECGIPGKAGTVWDGGIYKLVMEFSEDYPSRPPRCRFVPPLFHPNVYPSGTVCLSILDAEKGWRPSISVKELLIGVQDLLDNPNLSDPANGEAYSLYTRSQEAYTQKVRVIARGATPTS